MGPICVGLFLLPLFFQPCNGQERPVFPESACEGFFVKKPPLYYFFTPSHLQIYIFTPSHLLIYIFTPSHLQI
jgi:hypothetical protein